MTRTIIETRGGPLTEDDFAAEAPAPGASDRKYSLEARARFAAIGARVEGIVSTETHHLRNTAATET